MSNIGKRVKIKNYNSNYNGKTGVITVEQTYTFYVKLDEGTICQPYNFEWAHPECELIEEEFVLPTKWAFKTNDDFQSWIRTWDKTNPSNKLNVNGTRSNEYYFNSDVKNTKTWKYLEYLPLGYTEISFEQFKQYILKEKQTNMEKKIIGYKFKKDCEKFNQAAVQICQPTDIKDFTEEGYTVNMTADSVCKRKLEDANVLDLWFTPVFEEEEKPLEVGDFIMETWESSPFYNKQCFKVIAVSINAIKYDRSDSLVDKDKVRRATKEEEKTYKLRIIIHDYLAELENGKIKFGCQSFSKETLLELKDLFERSAFKFTCSIGKEPLSLEIINKLLKMYETS